MTIDRAGNIRTLTSWFATYYPDDTANVHAVAADRLYHLLTVGNMEHTKLTAFYALSYARAEVKARGEQCQD